MTKEREIPSEVPLHPKIAEIIAVYDAMDCGDIPSVTKREVAKSLKVSERVVMEVRKANAAEDKQRNSLLREIVVYPSKTARRHPQESEVIALLQEHIREGTMPPSYPVIAERLGMKSHLTVYEIAKRAGLQDALKELRKSEKNVFPPSKETAWFIGVVFSTRGSVDATRHEIAFAAKDEDLANAFKSTGEKLFSNDRVKKRAHVLNEQTHLAFFDNNAVKTLGDFRAKKKVESLVTRHAWVLEDRYKQSFLSGIVDAGAVFDRKKGNITFFTQDASISEFLIEQLGRIDVYAAEQNYEGTKSVMVRKRTSVKTLCRYVSSKSSEIQKKLDTLAAAQKKERRFIKPNSVAEIVAEWERLKDLNDGKSMSSNKINDLFEKDETRFSMSVYMSYFGETDGGPNKFSAARQRLDEIALLGAEEKNSIIASREIKTGNKKATKEEVLAEWERLSEIIDPPITIPKISKAYSEGRTPYTQHIYARYFGVEDGRKASFPLAREKLQKIMQSRRSSVAETIFSHEPDETS